MRVAVNIFDGRGRKRAEVFAESPLDAVQILNGLAFTAKHQNSTGVRKRKRRAKAQQAVPAQIKRRRRRKPSVAQAA